jgi:hypothetical protein
VLHERLCMILHRGPFTRATENVIALKLRQFCCLMASVLFFGPRSAWIHNIGGVVQLSGLDNFLVQIQQGKPQVYCAFGDLA